MGKVIAVCTSERKGIQKTSVPEIKVIEDWGIEGDAHAGKWHRQVSLLSFDKIEDFRARGAEVEDGAFGENLVVQGIDFATLPVIEMRVREILLKWLSDAMENVSFQARTEDGRRFFLDRSHMDEKCVVHCEDGNFTMPHMTIEFLEDEG